MTATNANSSATLLSERDGDLAIRTLNVPARLNPLTPDMQLGLREQLARLPAHAVREIRDACKSVGSQPLEVQMHDEAERYREPVDRALFAEGVPAFRQKCDPVLRSA